MPTRSTGKGAICSIMGPTMNEKTCRGPLHRSGQKKIRTLKPTREWESNNVLTKRDGRGGDGHTGTVDMKSQKRCLGSESAGTKCGNVDRDR